MVQQHSGGESFGDSQMAGRIRAFDWTTTPLGPIDQWPERLLVAVERMLAMPTVSTVVTRSSHLLLYNDSAATLYGESHPDALGRPLSQTFSTGWSAVRPFYERAFAGESVMIESVAIDTLGDGSDNNIFDGILAPLRDRNGDILAVEMIGFEVGEQTRSAQMLVESRQRYRDLFQRMGQGYAEIELLRDGDGKAIDQLYLELNPAFERLFGIAVEDALGRRASEVFPTLDARWTEFFASVSESGQQPRRLEHQLVPGGRWFEVLAYPRESNRLTVLYEDVTERKQSEATLRESEQRFRLIVESARDYAIFTTNSDDIIQDWLAGAENVFGWTREEAEGQSGSITYTSEDRAEGVPEMEIETARRDGKAPDVRWHRRKDSSRVFIEGQVIALPDENGTVQSFLKIGQDVTQRRLAEQSLRESEERFRQFGEASSDLLWIRSADTLAFEYLSPAFDKLYGVPRTDVLSSNDVKAWLELIHPDDRELAVETLRDLRAGIPNTTELRVVLPGGETRWLQDTNFALTDKNGVVERIAGIAQDITDRKQALELQGTLLAELQHRVRNVLAMLRSVVRRTGDTKSNVSDFIEHLEGRIDAMGRTQALLTRSPGQTVDLEQLIRDEMLAQSAAERKYAVKGAQVGLSPHAAEVLTLAIHELATNSVKYGALGQAEGRITISWETYDNGGAKQLELSWHETGIDQFAWGEPGFGVELITQRVPYELKGRGNFELANGELRATLEFPLRQGSSVLETNPILFSGDSR